MACLASALPVPENERDSSGPVFWAASGGGWRLS